MTNLFNLLTEPWIPCLFPGAHHPQPLGLHDTLVRAHEIREIYHDSPLTIAALHRLLLAVLHRVFGPADRDVWAELWKRKEKDWEQELDAYFESEACRGRFNLFDTERPFYQVAQFPPGVDPEIQPLAQLVHERVSGINSAIFDHNSDHLPEALLPAEAALRLITAQAFSLGLGKSFEFQGKRIDFHDAPCARGAWFMVEGEKLFQTLLLSMREYPRPNSRLPDLSEDKPSWEMDDAFADNRKTPNGYLDLLTWQSLRVKLICENGQVVGLQRVQGLALDKENVLDPLKSYRSGNRGEPIARGFSETRALWRDSVALLEIAGSNDSPENFRLLARLVSHGVLSPQQTYNYLAFGLTTEAGQARKVTLWRYERMPLPLAYLHGDEDDPQRKVNDLRQALDVAEGVHHTLKDVRDWLAWCWLYPTKISGYWKVVDTRDYKGRNKSNTYTGLCDRLPISRHYWWRLDEPFRRVFTGLAGDEEQSNRALQAWREEVHAAAHIAFTEVTRGLAQNPRALRALVEAQSLLNYDLKKLGLVLEKSKGDSRNE